MSKPYDKAAAQPLLRTARLLLRSFVQPDFPAPRRVADDPEVAASTLSTPHPCSEERAAPGSSVGRGWRGRGLAREVVRARVDGVLHGTLRDELGAARDGSPASAGVDRPVGARLER